MIDMNEREAAFRNKAQEFLNQKARVKHYKITGVFNEAYGDGDTFAIFEYSDEEVDRLKHLFSEAFMSYLELPAKEYTLEEIEEEVNLWELKGEIEELDELFFTPCEENYFMDPLYIDFEHPVYFYSMSSYIYNTDSQKMEGPAPFRIMLSDEEYVYLLTQQLMHREDFTQNRLFDMNTELAIKINRQAENAYWGCMSLHRMPFLVTMDEIVADAYQLDGPAPFHKRLYDDYTGTVETHHVLHVKSRRVCMLKEEINKVDHSIMCYTLKEISADELMARLEVFDYEAMAAEICKRFYDKNGYKQFRTFLDDMKIVYVVDDYQKN